MEYIEVPDGLIRKDLITKVKKYERSRYEGGTYYGVRIYENTTEHIYEKLDHGGFYSRGQEEWRDELYNTIKAQLVVENKEKNTSDLLEKGKEE